MDARTINRLRELNLNIPQRIWDNIDDYIMTEFVSGFRRYITLGKPNQLIEMEYILIEE